ncbi:unnamed protein product, partial [Discosporangium mesarthrocarpum]
MGRGAIQLSSSMSDAISGSFSLTAVSSPPSLPAFLAATPTVALTSVVGGSGFGSSAGSPSPASGGFCSSQHSSAMVLDHVPLGKEQGSSLGDHVPLGREQGSSLGISSTGDASSVFSSVDSFAGAGAGADSVCEDDPVTLSIQETSDRAAALLELW